MNYLKELNHYIHDKHLETQIINMKHIIKSKVINIDSIDNSKNIHIFINKSKQSSGYITFKNNFDTILSKGGNIIIYYLTDIGIEKAYGPLINKHEHLYYLFMLMCSDKNCYVTQYIDTIYKYIDDNKINNYFVYY